MIHREFSSISIQNFKRTPCTYFRCPEENLQTMLVSGILAHDGCFLLRSSLWWWTGPPPLLHCTVVLRTEEETETTRASFVLRPTHPTLRSLPWIWNIISENYAKDLCKTSANYKQRNFLPQPHFCSDLWWQIKMSIKNFSMGYKHAKYMHCTAKPFWVNSSFK